MSTASGRVAFHTFGCKVNQYDTESLATLFRRRGYLVVGFEEPADVYVINTCTVTDESDRKARRLIRRVRRRNPEAVVVVAGCYPQTAPGEVAGISGVDVVMGNRDRARVVDLVEASRREGADRGGAGPAHIAVDNIFRETAFEELGIEGFQGRTRASLKVQEGCNEFCTYCIIPYARGRPRSRRPGDVRAEVERLVRAGFREVVVTGIHLGAYGRDLPDRPTLAALLEAIHGVTGLLRIRVSSLEPMDVGEDLLDAMAALPKVCPHLHLPLQSGSERVLARMRRRYTAQGFRELVDLARRKIPGVAVSTDLIAGFPGETEDDHAATLAFIREIGFSRLHVFPFSPRKGTPAAADPEQAPRAVREMRARELAAAGERLAAGFNRRFLGREVEVLVEEDLGDGVFAGYSREYVRVRLQAGDGDFGPVPAGTDPRNALAMVLVEDAGAEGLRGRPVGSLRHDVPGVPVGGGESGR